MKPRFLLAIVCIVAAPATVHRLAAADTVAFVHPDDPAVADIKAIGERAINRIAVSLVQEAVSAVAREGAAKALDECHLRQLPAEGVIIPDMPRITGYKRTSLKLRDPANAPDEAELLALQRVQRGLENGDPPAVLIQRLDAPGRDTEWRVYKPVAVMRQCAACHGPKTGMSEDVRAELAARYPNDQAADYAVGAWRGVIRVTVAGAVPAPPAVDAIAKLPTSR